MNILIINASPRKNGLISNMLGIMRARIEEKGCNVEFVRANDLAVKPCTGCMSCRKSAKCVLPEDDSQRVLKLLQDADAVIVGAPCYWGNIPGQLKLLFDRMVYGMMRDTPRFPEPLMKGKRAILISTSTTPYPFNRLFNQTHGAIRALKEILGYAGIRLVGTIERGGTQMHPELSDKDRRKCEKLVGKLF